jgi:hypothetical protein
LRNAPSRASGRDRGQIEGLAVSQSPLVETGNQQRRTQRLAVLAVAGSTPALAARFDSASAAASAPGRLLWSAGTGGECILRHAGGETLGIGGNQRGELVAGDVGIHARDRWKVMALRSKQRQSERKG